MLLNGITVSVYLDRRRTSGDDPAPLRLMFRRRRKIAMATIGVSLMPSQWDARRSRVVRHSNAAGLNIMLTQTVLKAEEALVLLSSRLDLSSIELSRIRDLVITELNPEMKEKAASASAFRARFVRYMELARTRGTREVYRQTLRKMDLFDRDLACRRFEDIGLDWLRDFSAWCSKGERCNSVNIHLRCIRAVFNDAISAEITSAYPFRSFKVRPERTRKKALTLPQLHLLATMPVEPCHGLYRDMFMLMFYLRGINIGDLCLLKHSDLRDGRILYKRSKTGTLFSVKVEPEAAAILGKYRGREHLVSVLDTNRDYHTFMHNLNRTLKAIGRPAGKRGKIPGGGLFPELSSNWARHSWATAAAKLDIPKETIARSLGHSFGPAVTDIYIDFDFLKVDMANRRVIDAVLYREDRQSDGTVRER